MSDESWYHTSNGKAIGPETTAEMRRLVQEKKLGAEDLIWKPGMELWLELSKASPDWLKPEPKPAPAPTPVAVAKPAAKGKTMAPPSTGVVPVAKPVAESENVESIEKKGFLSRFFKR